MQHTPGCVEEGQHYPAAHSAMLLHTTASATAQPSSTAPRLPAAVVPPASIWGPPPGVKNIFCRSSDSAKHVTLGSSSCVGAAAAGPAAVGTPTLASSHPFTSSSSTAMMREPDWCSSNLWKPTSEQPDEDDIAAKDVESQGLRSVPPVAAAPKANRCWRRNVCCVVSAVVLVALVLAGAGAVLWRFLPRGAPPQPAWVEVQQQDMVTRDCRNLLFSGANAYDLPEIALGNTTNSTGPGNVMYGRQLVRATMRSAAAAGLKIMRTFTHSSSDGFPWQVGPGIYNPDALVSLDWVVAEAGAAGLQLVLSFTDNWKYYNGADQYVDWSNSTPARTWPLPHQQLADIDLKQAVGGDESWYRYEVQRHTLFFSDLGARSLYKAHVSAILNRRNVFTGNLYKDDTTIFSWNLINEPRCEVWVNSDCPDLLHDWLATMAAYVRSQDSVHLITYGSEGFFGPGPYEHLNPDSRLTQLGQDWLRNNKIPEIDYASLHVWPESWGVLQAPGKEAEQADFVSKWVKTHLTLAQQQLEGKLVMVEEFGKKMPVDPMHYSSTEDRRRLRDPVFAAVHALVVQQLVNPPGNLLGTLFWRLHVDAGFQGTGPYGVELQDSTGTLVQQQAQLLQGFLNAVPPSNRCHAASLPANATSLEDGSTHNASQQGPADMMRHPDNATTRAGSADLLLFEAGAGADAAQCWIGRTFSQTLTGALSALSSVGTRSSNGSGSGSGRRYCINSPGSCEAYLVLEAAVRKLALLGVAAVAPSEASQLQPLLFGQDWQAQVASAEDATAAAVPHSNPSNSVINALAAYAQTVQQRASADGMNTSTLRNSTNATGGSLQGVGYDQEVAYSARGLKQQPATANSTVPARFDMTNISISATVPAPAPTGQTVTAAVAQSPNQLYTVWLGGSKTVLVNLQQLVNLTVGLPQEMAAVVPSECLGLNASGTDLPGQPPKLFCSPDFSNGSSSRRSNVAARWLAGLGGLGTLYLPAPSAGVTSWATLMKNATRATVAQPAAAAASAVGRQLQQGLNTQQILSSDSSSDAASSSPPAPAGLVSLLSDNAALVVTRNNNVSQLAHAAASAAWDDSTKHQPQSCSAPRALATQLYNSSCMLPIPQAQLLSGVSQGGPAQSVLDSPYDSQTSDAGSSGNGAQVLVTAAMVDQALALLLQDMQHRTLATCPHQAAAESVLPAAKAGSGGFAAGVTSCGCDATCTRKQLQLAAAIMKQQPPAPGKEPASSSDMDAPASNRNVYAGFVQGAQLSFHASHQACCASGLGAFAEGCSS